MGMNHPPGCGCGAHGAASAPVVDPHAAREPGQVSLTGLLVCADPVEMLTVLENLRDHVEESRAEPGCLQFDLWQTEDLLIFALAERFADPAAYRAHQSRTRESRWGKLTAGIERRDYVRHGAD